MTRLGRLIIQTLKGEDEATFNHEDNFRIDQGLLHAINSLALNPSSDQEEDSLRQEGFQYNQDQCVNIATFRFKPSALRT